MLHNNKKVYLSYSLKFTPEEIALRDSFSDWLPHEIIDCHAHCNLSEHVTGMMDTTYWHMMSTFPSFTLEESEHIKGVFFPGGKVRTMRFAHVFRGVAHRKVNQYLLEKSKPEDRIALFGLPEDVTYTTEMLHHQRVSALKMYYSYVEPTATRIYEFFKPEILEVAQALCIPIILHLPKVISESRDDLNRVLRDFPNLRISIAHLGLSKVLSSGLEEAFKELSDYPNVFLDTALNPSTEVVRLAIRTFGEDRVMFGSDEPLHLVRSKVFIHPQKGQRLITEYPYHWVNPHDHRLYSHLAEGVTHCHWLSMTAIRSAIETFPIYDQERVKNKVFFQNAKLFFRF